MASLRALVALSSLFVVACQPAAFPRSGEVVARGKFSADVAFPLVEWAPQRAVLADHRALASEVSVFLAPSAAVRGSLGLCELGGIYQMTRVGVEARCGLLQQRLGAPLSLALSGAFAIDWGPYVGAFGRIGVDASRRFGPIEPVLDFYLSTGDTLRYIEDPGDPPIEGPLPGSKSVVRREVRATIPIGIAIRVAHYEHGDQWLSIVLGASPWFLLDAGTCGAACTTKWTGDHGVIFSFGIAIR